MKDATMVLSCLAQYRAARWSDPPCGGCCQGVLCQSIREVLREGDRAKESAGSQSKRLPSLVLIKDNGNGRG